MSRPAVLALLVVLSAVPGRAAVDPKIVEALTYVRDAGDGGALWDYLRRDPVPVVFARLPLGVDSRYVRKQGKAWIELSDRLHGERGPALGRELYHQYIHRLQDRSPELVTAAEAETVVGYRTAMRYLRSQVRPRGDPPEAPAEVRAAFDVEEGTHRHAHRKGSILRVYTSGR